MALYFPTLKMLSAIERNGVMEEMRLEALVTGLSNYGYNAIFSAMETAGVPVPGDGLDGNTDLILVERIPRIEPDDVTKVRIELVYKRDATYPVEGAWIWRGGTSVVETVTETDKNATPDPGTGLLPQLPVLSHTFPATDKVWPNEEVNQPGSVEYLAPQGVVQAQGLINTTAPFDISEGYAGYINSQPWGNAAAGMWLCTNVQFEPHTPSENLWMFTFEFQRHDGAGWQPTIMFIDPRFDRPPPDLEIGVGYKRLANWYPERDFCVDFGPCT